MIARTPAFLMANLGSDISQLFSHLERGESELAASAARRARGIMAELLRHKELQGRTGEIEVLQHIVSDALLEKPLLRVTKGELDAYFMPFSMRVLGEGI
ncbi:MAG: hypothetical protein A2849_00270 [Candidatus Taylorbacteria bacterium RIFCSPHIGHO2_01_FULL_51_15]|uniref:Uncharacterized protein n=1 Tax=Candidatus Taylorbacteria bacterium RIFCSPHIGHO2_01_FULL_51_15 TaxID=1802304 RepID=A0A1G2MBX3_9BACT|nr:MAG: hypothetical protein A2849_00270 [Candidatus Taylorbacteria bacterium RIFCSPHIGHO2_01_FULL_51_15]